MRKIVSFSLKEETISKLKEKLSGDNLYRNKSHLVECALARYLENEQ